VLIPRTKPKLPSSRSRREPEQAQSRRRKRRRNRAPVNYADFANKSKFPVTEGEKPNRYYRDRYLEEDYRTKRPPKFNNGLARTCFQILQKLKKH